MGENRMEAGKEPSNLWLRASQIYNDILPQCIPPPASHWAVHGLAPGHKTCSGCCRESQSPGEPRVVFKPCVPSCEVEVFLPGQIALLSLSVFSSPSPSFSFFFFCLSQNLLPSCHLALYSWAGIFPCLWFLVISVLSLCPGQFLRLPGAALSLGPCLHSLSVPFLFYFLP